ncbi:MAG: helix-turn-helix domain-containing protein [Deinococcales bacterium]
MDDTPSARPAVTVRETSAATVLLDPVRRRNLEPFMRAERSISEAAREVGVPVKDMAYRVKRFAALGLLESTREQPRGGRAIRFYRAPEQFFVPFAVLPEPDLEEMVDALVRPLQTLAVQGTVHAMVSAEEGMIDWGWLLQLHEQGVSVGPAPGPDAGRGPFERLLLGEAAPMLLSWAPLRLTRERAGELRQALVDVLLRFQADDGPEAFILGLALAPLEEDLWGERGEP